MTLAGLADSTVQQERVRKYGYVPGSEIALQIGYQGMSVEERILIHSV
jgi:hypothetical protein